MIKSCNRCGGLYATVQGEAFAGLPCKCAIPDQGSVFRFDHAAAGQEFVPIGHGFCPLCGSELRKDLYRRTNPQTTNEESHSQAS